MKNSRLSKKDCAEYNSVRGALIALTDGMEALLSGPIAVNGMTERQQACLRNLRGSGGVLVQAKSVIARTLSA